MDQRENLTFLEEEITAMVEETEAKQPVLFGGLNSGLTNCCALFTKLLQRSPQSWTCMCRLDTWKVAYVTLVRDNYFHAKLRSSGFRRFSA